MHKKDLSIVAEDQLETDASIYESGVTNKHERDSEKSINEDDWKNL